MKQFILALTSLTTLAAVPSVTHAHGFISKPQARMPGSAMQSACGEQVYNNQKSDNYGNVQGELQITQGQTDYDAAKCDIWLCKGYKFADNKANVQSYTAGQKVPFEIDIRAPHTGVANVSVVDTKSNSVIGSPLKSWDKYASTASGVTDDETKFSVTIPEDLGGKCASPGDCVLQWYWFAESIDQTYESCVDFTVGSGSGSGSAGSNNKVAAVAADAAPTTMVTKAASQTASSVARSSAPIPKNGSPEQKMNWVSGLVRSIADYA